MRVPRVFHDLRGSQIVLEWNANAFEHGEQKTRILRAREFVLAVNHKVRHASHFLMPRLDFTDHLRLEVVGREEGANRVLRGTTTRRWRKKNAKYNRVMIGTESRWLAVPGWQ